MHIISADGTESWPLMTKDEVAGLMSKLQSERIVNLAVATP